ncbi:GlsB/YeaQ/YmgE family stress response membrane protein [Brucella sp. BE17]|uniref:GlsB/YeaQ/YmgE family stress response membrane protein n=1 Tax=Brucella sp. BE17 TaxID=3142977 RepID=UPI0031BB9722
MEVGSLIAFLFVGLIAGWLAGKIVQGGGFGLFGNIIVGVIGAFFAGWLLPRLGFSVGGGLIQDIVNAFIGAAILLIILRIIKRA